MPQGGAGRVHLLGGERQGIKHEEGERPAYGKEEGPLYMGAGEGLRDSCAPRVDTAHNPHSLVEPDSFTGSRIATGAPS